MDDNHPDFGLRIWDCGFGIADCGSRIADCRLRIVVIFPPLSPSFCGIRISSYIPRANPKFEFGKGPESGFRAFRS